MKWCLCVCVCLCVQNTLQFIKQCWKMPGRPLFLVLIREDNIKYYLHSIIVLLSFFCGLPAVWSLSQSTLPSPISSYITHYLIFCLTSDSSLQQNVLTENLFRFFSPSIMFLFLLLPSIFSLQYVLSVFIAERCYCTFACWLGDNVSHLYHYNLAGGLITVVLTVIQGAIC